MPYKNVSLSLPAELLPIINEAAKDSYCSRSDYIREAIVIRLKVEYPSTGRPELPSKPKPVINPDGEI